MKFTLSAPSADLKEYVRSFFRAEITRTAAGKDMMIASGRSYLMFYINKTAKLFTQSGIIDLEKIMLAGQQYRFYQYQAPKGFTIIGLSFQPTGLHRLFGIDMYKTFSKHISIKKFLPGEDVELWLKQVQKADSFADKQTVIENIIRDLIQNRKEPSSIIEYVAADVIEKRGLPHISEYSQKLKTSQRYLEQLFRYKVGITPGKFAKVNRFFYLFTDIVNNSCCNDKLIKEFGYYDRAHFRKDFKAFTGTVPEELLELPLDFIRSYLREYKRFYRI